jgi:hypothetical protein
MNRTRATAVILAAGVAAGLSLAACSPGPPGDGRPASETATASSDGDEPGAEPATAGMPPAEQSAAASTAPSTPGGEAQTAQRGSTGAEQRSDSYTPGGDAGAGAKDP